MIPLRFDINRGGRMYTFLALFGSFISTWAILAWLACGFFAGHLGDEKGRCGVCWLLLGLLFGPLALLTAVGLPARGPNRTTHAQCHVCHEFVLPQARKCKHCHSGFASDGYTQAQAERQENIAAIKEHAPKILSNPVLWVAAVIVIAGLYFVF